MSIASGVCVHVGLSSLSANVFILMSCFASVSQTLKIDLCVQTCESKERITVLWCLLSESLCCV